MSEDTNKNFEKDLEFSFSVNEIVDLIKENEENREAAEIFYQGTKENTQKR